MAFEIPLPAPASLPRRAALGVARPFLDWALGLPTFRELHRRAADAPGGTFAARALHTLNIDVVLERSQLASLPASGPLLVVSNHPHGMLDGLALAHLVHEQRGDVRVLTSHLLSRLEDLADLCFFVDPSGDRAAARRSYAGLRAARKWLDAGRALVVFPAGGVAHLHASTDVTPADSPWHATAARLAIATDAQVVPAFIRGRNSAWFYRAGYLDERLRTLLLGRELLGHRGRPVSVALGRPISPAPERPAAGAIAATAWFRREVDALARSTDANRPANPEPVVEPLPSDALAAEIHRLAPEALLLRSGRFDVYCTRSRAIPHVLREIGRLREHSFRAVGEGTGRAIDLDRFDEHYLHLFVWNRDAREIVGGYRMGLTDEILASHGLDGLYTSTLFRFDRRLIARLSPAIELGRSFVRAEYQRSSNALLLLWKGIARYVAQSRTYRVLFGPVSVSSRYSERSQQLLSAFLIRNASHPEFAKLVEALTPPPPAALTGAVDPVVDHIGILDRTIASLEPDGKGIPVLLRQYLKLNAQFLGFNVDHHFGNALDALMMVDLARVEPAILRRYFGQDAEPFVAASRPAAA